MKADWKTRLGFWLEKFEWLHPVLLEKFGVVDIYGQQLYSNRVNGHIVVKKEG